jgi:MraZ protein
MDERNRVSVPVLFRGKKDGDAAVFFGYPSYVNKCIEVCTQERMTSIQRSIDQLDVFSVQRDSMATVILSDTEGLQLDNKGRIVVSERLKSYAELGAQVLFVGKGATFEIWNPKEFELHYKKARDYVISNKLVLKGDGHV